MTDVLTQLLQTGARQLLAQAIEAEVSDFLVQFQDRCLENGRAAVVRNGPQPMCDIQTGIGPVSVKVPKVRARDGEPVTFRSALVPPVVRRTKSLEAALPWLYLKGISSGKIQSALEVLVGPEAKGLSASTISRLKQTWGAEDETWCKARLDKDQWVCIWGDGIHSGHRSDDSKLCALTAIGVNEQGKKQILAIEDGTRESTQNWREVLLKLKARGMNSPKLATGDGALGFWAAVDQIYPDTRQQRCWVHKTSNVLNNLPKSSQPKAKQGLHDIWMAETKADALKAFDLFIETYKEQVSEGGSVSTQGSARASDVL